MQFVLKVQSLLVEHSVEVLSLNLEYRYIESIEASERAIFVDGVKKRPIGYLYAVYLSYIFIIIIYIYKMSSH